MGSGLLGSRKSDADAGKEEPKKAKTTKSPSKHKNEIPDISGVHLDGEEARAVEVYDTCDMVRSKIKLFMKQHPAETNASFARRCDTRYTGLAKFREKKGYDKGSTSAAFYDAYVYLEKLRIAQDKPKSKDRVKMEEIWGARGGFNTTTLSNNKGILMTSSDHITGKNKYGEWTVTFESGKKMTGPM